MVVGVELHITSFMCSWRMNVNNLVMCTDLSFRKTLPTIKLRILSMYVRIIKSLLMVRGFLDPHKATFKKVDDFLISALPSQLVC